MLCTFLELNSPTLKHTEKTSIPFPFKLNFETSGIPFGSKSKRKLSLRSYPIQFERRWNDSFLGVRS